MDLVKTIIIKALPEASTDLVTSVLANMEDHGVNSIDHLKYFKPETDCTVLKTIQRRVLQKEIESYFAENKSQEIEEVASTSYLPTPIANPSQFVCSSSFEIVENFNIPYHKFPRLIEQEKVPSIPQRLAIVRLICDDLQEIIDKPLKKHLEVIARKIVEKYPKSFQDTINGQKLGNGYSSLLCQLVNRCENTRRPSSSSTKRKLGQDGRIKKISNADSYGCVRLNYLPDFASDDDASAQEFKKVELQELYTHVKWNQEKVDSLMDETYTAQRFIIVKNVEFNIVIEEFPFLSVSLYFLKHLESRLIGFDLLQRLSNSVEDKASEVIKCIKNDHNTGINQLQFIEVLCEYFEEEKKEFMMIFEKEKSITEITTEVCPVTPIILALGNPYDSESKCIICWGNSHFADFTDFVTAVAMWFGSFYVFNLKYPETLQATMEFIQRAFLDINPEKGSKAKKTPKPCNINSKVRKLITKLAAFRWLVEA